jgi:hypothetical protein
VNVRYGSLRLGAATLYRRLRGKADVGRWADLDSFEPDWASRTALIAGLIPPGARVIEFGAGRRHLEGMLAPGCVYIPSDLVSRGPDTLVADLDARPLPDLAPQRPDVAVFAGVLEYLGRLPDVPPWLFGEVTRCVASYECATSRARTVGRVREALQRYRNGWITTYSEDELVALFESAGWRCDERLTWSTPDGNERIFAFSRP